MLIKPIEYRNWNNRTDILQYPRTTRILRHLIHALNLQVFLLKYELGDEKGWNYLQLLGMEHIRAQKRDPLSGLLMYVCSDEFTMSKVTKLECPNCGAGLPAPEEGNSLICCPYCATPLNYDKHDASFKIDKKVEKVTHKIDHAKLAEIAYKERKDKAENRFWFWYFIIFGSFIGIFAFLYLVRI